MVGWARTLPVTEAARQAAVAARGASRPERRQPVRRPLPEHLPREEIIHTPAEICPGCGGTHFSRLGEDFTEVLEKIPARLKVIRHVRPKILLPDLRDHPPSTGS